MSAIENRIVTMKFVNSDFRKGAQEAISDLNTLDKKISSVGQGGEIDASLSNINKKFLAMTTIGVTALSRLTNSVIDAGKRMGAALINPIVEGGKRRAQNIELAKFQFKGLGLDVEKSMSIANAAVEGTAYGLDSAAKAAGQLAASNVAMGADMEQALRGIAGVAAMTGSSYDEIANIFIKVSGQGRLMGDDLLSLSARGMNAAAVLAKAMGVTESEVRDMVSKSQISFADFSKAMDDAYGAHAKAANETFSGSLANMNAALARIGEMFESKKMQAAIPLFAAITKAINACKEALKPLADAYGELLQNRNNFLIPFFEGLASAIQKATPAIQNVVTGFMNIGKAVASYIKPIGSAIADLFNFDGSSFFNFLTNATGGFKNFTQNLILSEGQTQKFKSALSSVTGVLKNVASKIGEFASSVFEAGKSIGQGLTPYIEAAKNGFQEFGSSIGEYLSQALDKVKNFINQVKNFFSNLDFSSAFDSIIPDTNPFEKAGSVFRKGAQEFNASTAPVVSASILDIGEVASEAFSGIGDFIGRAMDGIKNVFSNFSFDKLLTSANFAMMTTAAFNLANGARKLMGSFSGIADGFRDFLSSMSSIPDSIQGLAEAISNFGNKTEGLAPKIIAIALAIGILSGAVFLLSKVPIDSLAPALGAVAAMLAELTGAIYILTNLAQGGGILKASFSMILMSTALVILSGAIKMLAAVPTDQLEQGLVAVATALVLLTGSLAILGAVGGPMLSAALSMIFMSVALGILAGVIAFMGMLPLDMLQQGLIAVGIALAGLSVAVMLMQNTNLLGTGVGLLLVSAALVVMSAAVAILGSMNLGTMTQGLIGVAVALGILALASNLAKGAVGGAVAMLIISAACVALAGAIMLLGAVPFSVVVQGLAALAVGLAILTAAGLAAQAGLMGLAALAGVILAFGAASLMVASATVIFAAGLAAMGPAMMIAAAGLAVLSAAARENVAAILPMVGLAAGLAAFGAGLAVVGAAMVVAGAGAVLLGAGFVALGTGFTMVAATAAPAGTALSSFIDNFSVLDMGKMAALGAALIPLGAGMLALGAGTTVASVGLLAVAAGFVAVSPALNAFKNASQGLDVAASSYKTLASALTPMSSILLSMSAGLISTASGFVALSASMSTVSSASQAASTGIQLLATTMQRLPAAVASMAASVTTSFAALAAGVSAGMSVVIAAVASNVGRFQASLTALPRAVSSSSGALIAAFAVLNVGVRAGMMLLVTTFKAMSAQFLQQVKALAQKASQAFRQVGQGFAKAAPANVNAARNATRQITNAVTSTLSGSRGTMSSGGYSAGVAMTQGMVSGLSAGSGSVSSMARSVAVRALNSAKSALGIASPSKEFAELGMYSMMGFSKGIEKNQSKIYSSVDMVGRSTIDSMQQSLNGLDGILDSIASESINVEVELQTDGIDDFNRELSNLMAKASVIPTISAFPDTKVAETQAPVKVEALPKEKKQEEPPQNITKVFNYTQNNNSPKALSNVDIYRNTKSQLASMRKALNI